MPPTRWPPREGRPLVVLMIPLAVYSFTLPRKRPQPLISALEPHDQFPHELLVPLSRLHISIHYHHKYVSIRSTCLPQQNHLPAIMRPDQAIHNLPLEQIQDQHPQLVHLPRLLI